MPTSQKPDIAALMNFLKQPADGDIGALPNLQTIAEDAVAIANVVREFKINAAAWVAFGDYVATAVMQLLQPLGVLDALDTSYHVNLSLSAQYCSKQRAEPSTRTTSDLAPLHERAIFGLGVNTSTL
ncbi:hypothetical protein FS749_008282 [Ceratobasidium sp. UAMH 11750]|nr:hypothetical protein FS749_008282 [Ceratobasidium sp. UAMH 11750]